MPKPNSSFIFVFLTLLMLLLPPIAPTTAQEPGFSPEAMAAWQKAITPGEPHAYLAKFAGEWVYESTFWMAPDAPPQTSRGTSSKKMVFGGRYLEENIEGDMMGEPFQGRATTGYDNTTRQFLGTWIDNISTMTMVSHGTYDGGGTLTLTAEYTDPFTGRPSKARMVSRIVGPDHHTFEYYTTPAGGEEFKSMAILYKRK